MHACVDFNLPGPSFTPVAILAAGKGGGVRGMGFPFVETSSRPVTNRPKGPPLSPLQPVPGRPDEGRAWLINGGH